MLGKNGHLLREMCARQFSDIKSPLIKSTPAWSYMKRRKQSEEADHECRFCNIKLPNSSTLKLHLSRRHKGRLSALLRQTPEKTYAAIFKEKPRKSVTSSELRYGDGFVISLKGSHKGNFYSFTKNVGGGPLTAIQMEFDVGLAEAMEIGARIAGVGGHRDLESFDVEEIGGKTALDLEESKRISVEAAKSIWNSAVPMTGTWAEKYLVRARGIPQDVVRRLAFKFLESGAVFHEDDVAKVNSSPALLIPVENARGELTGLQRVFLDKNSPKKPVTASGHKYSIGRVKGSAGIVQRGDSHKRVFVVEGPETGASVAAAVGAAHPVLAALSVSNLAGLADVIARFHPSEVIVAGDNDVDPEKASMKITRKSCSILQKKLSPLKVSLVLPNLRGQQRELDWNDVLLSEGIQSLEEQLN